VNRLARRSPQQTGCATTIPQSLDSPPLSNIIEAARGWRGNVVCSLLEKIELLHAAGTQFRPPHAGEIVKNLYDILNVLDEKGLAPLAFDGIVVAATTFAAEKGGVFHRPDWRDGWRLQLSSCRLPQLHCVSGFRKFPIDFFNMLNAARRTNRIFPMR
jgi:hypothetical protein